MIFSVPWEVVKLQSSLLVENGVRSESKILVVSCLLGGMREIETNLPSLTLAKERRALKASVRSRRHSARIVVFLALWAADGRAADASDGTTDGGSDAE